jgi:hypothetical protein
MTLPENICPFL